MESAELKMETEPAFEDVEFLEDRITEFNIPTTGITSGQLLASFARDHANQVTAGIYGWTWGGCCEIRYLWVREDLRGKGIGRQLLSAVEAEAKARGCTQVVLDTHSFQAPGFYRKYGYETVCEIDDYPLREKKIYLRKRLD